MCLYFILATYFCESKTAHLAGFAAYFYFYRIIMLFCDLPELWTFHKKLIYRLGFKID